MSWQWSELHVEGIVDCLVISYQQVASLKSVLPYYYLTHVTESDQLLEQGQTLVHFRNHFTYDWSPLEEEITKIIESQHVCG